MPRLPRICPPGIPQHIIQRGNNRQRCFVAAKDFAAYARWLHEFSCKYDVAIHAWVFMTNHVHLLATPRTEDGVSRMMQCVGRQFVRHFNRAYGRTGTLWEGRFKSSVVDEEGYLLACQRYIELNPVRAGMVGDPADYRWSSYHAHAFGTKTNLWSPHEVYLCLGSTDCSRRACYRELFAEQLGQPVLDRIRTSVNKNLPLGSDRFTVRMERMTGQRLTPAKRGPKSKMARTPGI